MEDDITASVVVPARRLVGLPGRVRRASQPQAGGELRVPAVPAARRRDPSRLRPPDRGGHGAAPGSSARTSSRSPRQTRSASSRTSRCTTPSRRRCARTWPGTPRGADGGYSICSAQPRLIGGKPTKNPRYLQVRPDLARPRDRYVAEMGARLYRRLPLHAPVLFPVISVLSGRRNNRPDGGHPPALRVRAHPLPGAARAVHGLRLLAHRQVAQHDRRGLRGRAHEGAVQRPRARPRISTTRWSPCCSPATPASAPPPATSARASASTTTSAC